MKTLKNPGGVYVVRIQTEYGRRTISTGTKNLEEAQKIIRGAKVKELELTAKTVRLTRDVVAQIVTGRKVKVLEAIEEWNQWMGDSHKAQRTAANDLMTVRAWARDMKMEERPINAVTKKEIDRWINNSKDEGKASWKRVKLSCIRRFFDFCSIRNYCLGNPSKLVGLDFQKMSHAQKERREVRVYSPEEIALLVNYTGDRRRAEESKIAEADGMLAELPNLQLQRAAEAGQHRKWEGILEKARAWRRHWQFWEFAVVFGRYTGLRLGDICQLEWDCFKSGGKMIVWTDKRNRRVELPMGPETVKVYEMRSAERGMRNSPYLFPERREQVLDDKKRAGLSVEFSRLSKAAGVMGHVFHELRSTHLTDFVRQGNSIEAAAKAAGHAHTSTTMGYVKEA